MRRRLPPSARPSVMSAAIFETGFEATTTPVAPAVPRVFAFSMQAEQSIVVDPKSPGGHQLAARPDPVRRRMRPMLARLPLREQT